MALPYQAAVSGQPYKNKGGTILQAGNASTTLVNNLTIGNSLFRKATLTAPTLAVSPASSGNLGTVKPLSAGVFASMEKGKYVGMVIGTRIAQTNNTILATGASEVARKNLINVFYGDRRINITSWNAVTGAATKGGSTGALVTFNSDDAANPTNAIPGELQFMDGSKNPVQKDYAAKTNP